MGLKSRLLLLVLISLLPAVAIQAYTSYSLRSYQEAEVQRQAVRDAELVTSELERLFEGIRNLLTAVAEDPAIRSFEDDCVVYISILQSKMPHLRSLSVLDRDGNTPCRRARMPEGVEFAGEDYFEGALNGAEFAIGTYSVGAVTGEPILPMAIPLRDLGGQIIGVVAASLDLSWLSQQLADRTVPVGGSVTVADREGTIIARQPLPERFVGTRIPDQYMHLVRAERPGALELVSQDGTPRILGYVPPAGDPNALYVSTGIPAADAFAVVNSTTQWGIALIALSIILALAAAWFVGRDFVERPVRQLLRAADAWSRGDYAVRTGLSPDRGEFGRIGAALDNMVAQIGGREEELRARERQQRMLTNELNHRVKNTLATIQSIAAQTARSAPDLASYRKSFEARLLALSKTHNLLTSSSWEAAELRDLLESELKPHQSRGSHRYRLVGASVRLGPRQALAVGMVAHELTTNAAKYGALSNPAGSVEVAWTTRGNDPARLHLVWTEHDGPVVAPPKRQGFGSRLLEASIARDLGGVVTQEFRPEGLVCTIEFDLAHSNEPQADQEVGADARLDLVSEEG